MGKQRLAFLTDFVEALSWRDRRRTGSDEARARSALDRPAGERLAAACRVLMGRMGDAARLAVAEQALEAYAALGPAERSAFFALLRDEFGVSAEAIRAAYAGWDRGQTPEAAALLFRAAEPARQTLLRRLNMAPGATLKLVEMRADLLAAMRGDPGLAPVDEDFAHLFASWFNRGFLTLRRIDWNSPAAVLERIMHYESVHAMEGWDDLRRRLAARDRRLFAFFHPATGDEPLIFVEVALTAGMPGRIGEILTQPETGEAVEADTAVFYSINNCLPGLKGVSFGNFLIKQVVAVLAAELPRLETFVTLSPVPGFARWLAAEADPRAQALGQALGRGDWQHDAAAAAALWPELEAVAARYIVEARDAGGRMPDPVGRFHLGNGATAFRLNWPADLSPGAIHSAHGLMINYLYDPGVIEIQHEAFVRDGTVAHGPALARALARKTT